METAVVEFRNLHTGYSAELEIPLAITAGDLIYALNSAFDLGLDPGDCSKGCLTAENPIAFLRGNRTLGEFGLHNGSIIFFKRGSQKL